MSIDILYVSHNRLEFTKASFQALLDNTNWELVDNLIVIDDHSAFGPITYLTETLRNAPVTSKFITGKFGGPVSILNKALDMSSATMLAKIDNDLVVCPQWLEHMSAVLTSSKSIDALGMEPGFGDRVQPLDVRRAARSARWIGGIGLFRTKVFRRRRPAQHDRYFGLTQFWRRHAHTAWISPDLPCFLLDHLPYEPWASLARDYVERGWSRRWSPYDPDMADAYAGWWTRQEVVA